MLVVMVLMMGYYDSSVSPPHARVVGILFQRGGSMKYKRSNVVFA